MFDVVSAAETLAEDVVDASGLHDHPNG